MTIIDISRNLQIGMAVWPGDSPYHLETIMDRRQGHAVNLTTLTLSAHTGSHADAPRHFTDDGLTMDAVDLRPYWGPALVVTVNKAAGPLLPSDFAAYDLRGAERLLVRTPLQDLPFDQFPDDLPHPSPALADFLGKLGILLYGTDTPSMDAIDSHDLPGHNALLRNGIDILEGLDFSGVVDGRYELVALPLKIVGGDGSPVRAALRPLT
ncbi:MAG: cyclase family protein [Ardenticatenaceae bacterium]|nr:cyclase family protein [Ardenticatenaceae bacterium]